MKNGKEIIGNLLIAAGMLTGAKGATDFVLNRGNLALQQGSQATARLTQQYGIEEKCNSRICVNTIPNAPSKEEEMRMLEGFRQELKDQSCQIPGADQAQENIDQMMGGFIATLGGIALKKGGE